MASPHVTLYGYTPRVRPSRVITFVWLGIFFSALLFVWKYGLGTLAPPQTGKPITGLQD